MKKILCLLCLVTILSLSACSEESQILDAAFQPPIEDVNWGMTPEEVMDILALPEDCIFNGDEGTITLQCENMDIFGQSADVVMSFDVQYKMGLMNMIIFFTDLSDESLVEALNHAYGDYSAVDSEGVPCRWESEKIEDMSERIQERFQYVLLESPAWNDGQGVFSKETVWNEKKGQPLVAVTLNGSILYYNAGHMAGYLLFDDDNAYEELQGYLNDVTK